MSKPLEQLIDKIKTNTCDQQEFNAFMGSVPFLVTLDDQDKKALIESFQSNTTLKEMRSPELRLTVANDSHTMHHILEMFTLNKTITTLKLKVKLHKIEDMKILAQALIQNQSIERLDLDIEVRGTIIHTDYITLLCTIINEKKTLTELRLSLENSAFKYVLETKELTSLLQCLAQHPNIKGVSFFNTRFSIASISLLMDYLATKMPQISTLNLLGHSFEGTMMHDIATHIKMNPNITALNLVKTTPRSMSYPTSDLMDIIQCKTLTDLNLSDNVFGFDFYDIPGALAKNTRLKKLDLSDNRLKLPHLKTLIAMLKKHPSITEINIEDNFPCPANDYNRTRLDTHMDTEWLSLIIELIKENPNISVLKIAGNYASAKELQAFSKFIAENTTLKVLSFGCGNDPSNTIDSLLLYQGLALNRSLTHVTLRKAPNTQALIIPLYSHATITSYNFSFGSNFNIALESNLTIFKALLELPIRNQKIQHMVLTTEHNKHLRVKQYEMFNLSDQALHRNRTQAEMRYIFAQGLCDKNSTLHQHLKSDKLYAPKVNELIFSFAACATKAMLTQQENAQQKELQGQEIKQEEEQALLNSKAKQEAQQKPISETQESLIALDVEINDLKAQLSQLLKNN